MRDDDKARIPSVAPMAAPQSAATAISSACSGRLRKEAQARDLNRKRPAEAGRNLRFQGTRSSLRLPVSDRMDWKMFTKSR